MNGRFIDGDTAEEIIGLLEAQPCGFFACDGPYEPPKDMCTCRTHRVLYHMYCLFPEHIPDGVTFQFPPQPKEYHVTGSNGRYCVRNHRGDVKLAGLSKDEADRRARLMNRGIFEKYVPHYDVPDIARNLP